jgi:hypothetical protein
MVPRTPGVIISTLLETEELEKNIVNNFASVIKELYTHPRKDLNTELIKIKDEDIFCIREHLFIICVETVGKNAFLQQRIQINNTTPTANLCRRYKASKCYDDIYIIAMTIIEKKLHKDIPKIILNVISTEPETEQQLQPKISSAESAIIKELHAIRDAMTFIRNENKELKQKLNLAITKIDNHENTISGLRKAIEANTASRNDSGSLASSQRWSDHLFGPPSSDPPLFSMEAKKNQGGTNSLKGRRPPAPHLERSATSNNLINNRDPNLISNNNSNITITSNSRNTNANNNKNSTSTTTNSNNNINNDQVSNDGFQQVRVRRKPVFGSKKPTQGQHIAGQRIQREFPLFIGGLRKDLTSEDFQSFIHDSLEITPIRVEINRTNDYNRSFKVTVYHKDKNTMFSSGNWEENIIIKPFRTPRIQ